MTDFISLTASEVESELTARGYYRQSEVITPPYAPAISQTAQPQAVEAGQKSGISMWLLIIIGAVGLIGMEGIKESE